MRVLRSPRNLETRKDGSLAFASQHDCLYLIGGSPSRRARSSTQHTASIRSKKPEAGRATKTIPGQVPRGRKTDVSQVEFSKKRKRDENEDNEEERNRGPVSLSFSGAMSKLTDW
ncbi:hypothetical protein FRC14_005718 [Serendipita sp. 396]|nr:hypothetical protein FRC14_005718 [Serendipita sp. 396]KAG8780169.1 hypothetical protein FRC15_009708 [Serendipita sp. 397]KAG8797013.1 hypothetical protein FRC16_009289 [Serendipita sp. 398]KAG8819632.1 hypothetical protein FRC18_011971 [Serendipita sp. 400]KAG8865634.1 hypothetical protein FRC20_009625 [Serendipita sp. 405]